MTEQVPESARPAMSPVTSTAVDTAASGQPTSSGKVTFTEEQWSAVNEIVERRVKSHNDVRLGKLDTEVKELRLLLQQPQASQSPTQPSQAQVPSLTNGVTQAAQPSVEYYESVISEVGFDPNDREVWSLAGENKNEKDFLYALHQLKKQRATQPPPSLSAVPPSSPGEIGTLDNNTIIDNLSAELQTLTSDPLALTSPQGRKRLAEIQKEMAIAAKGK